jgi:hypothetical protein
VSLINNDFGEFIIGKGCRTPIEIINHMYYTIKATRIFVTEGKFHKNESKKLNLGSEIGRFNLELDTLDKILAQKELDTNISKKLLQGPFSDILTHIGQISMLSRLFGNPIRREDFSSAI